MKLSSALELGSVLGGMKPQDINNCALGRAADAVGIPKQARPASTCTRIDAIYDRWPWLAANNEEHGQAIMELFDHHVCKGTMTLNALIEHIKTIEPSCPTCCGFDCCCARAEYLLEKMATERDSQKMSV